jgi:hypothetical protein
MRRAVTITLVLMTGAATALGLSTCGESVSAECAQARAEGRPDAEQLCARSRSSSGSRSWYSSHTGSGSTGSHMSQGSERGGFGGTAHAAGS